LTGTLTVLAASSLTESFGEIGRRFEAEHPGLTVSFNFGASSGLSRQLVEGAPGDVLATADEASMQRAVDAHAARPPAVFARNRLEIATRPGNPEAVAGLADLARPGLVVVLCAPEVPCGTLARAALDKAGVRVTPASSEENVKAVLAKVTLGEADAGIVYVTDVVAAGAAVTGVPVPDAQNVVASCSLAVATTAANPSAARAWLDYVVSPVGREVLSRFGFTPADG
jgi:molybdate transport system substrate-binding protein